MFIFEGLIHMLLLTLRNITRMCCLTYLMPSCYHDISNSVYDRMTFCRVAWSFRGDVGASSYPFSLLSRLFLFMSLMSPIQRGWISDICLRVSFNYILISYIIYNYIYRFYYNFSPKVKYSKDPTIWEISKKYLFITSIIKLTKLFSIP